MMSKTCITIFFHDQKINSVGHKSQEHPENLVKTNHLSWNPIHQSFWKSVLPNLDNSH